MAERQPGIETLIRRASLESEPITLDEVKGRAERNDWSDLLPEPFAVAAAPTARRPISRRWVAAAVLVVAGLVAILGGMLGRDESGRILSTGPAADAPGAGSIPSTSAPVIDSTLMPAEESPAVVALDVGFPVHALLVLDDGRLAVAGTSDTMQYWDPESPDDGSRVVRLEEPFDVGGRQRTVSRLAPLPAGGLVVVSSFVESVTVDEIDPDSGVGLRGGQLTSNVAPEAPATLLRDGHLAVGGTDGMVTIEAVGDGGPRIGTPHTGTVLAIAELPDGILVSGGGEGTIRMWDPDDGIEDQRSPVSAGHSGPITALTVLPDGRVASGDANGALRVWEPDGTGDLQMLDGHGDAVDELAVLPDGRLVSGGADGTLRIWNLDAPAAEPELLDQHDGAVNALAVLPDGRLASGGSDGTVRIWTVGEARSSTSPPSARPPASTPSSVVESGREDGGDIPVLAAERAPLVVECESGPPEYPANDGEPDLDSAVFPTPEEALDDVLASIPGGGTGWKEELIRIDTPDGAINYAAPTERVLPVGSQPIDEAVFLVVIRPTGSGQGFVAISWERVGC